MTIYYYDVKLEIFDSCHHLVSKISYPHWDFWHSYVVPVEVLPVSDRDFWFSLWQHKFVIQTIDIMADNGSCPPPRCASGMTKWKSRNTSLPPKTGEHAFFPVAHLMPLNLLSRQAIMISPLPHIVDFTPPLLHLTLMLLLSARIMKLSTLNAPKI